MSHTRGLTRGLIWRECGARLHHCHGLCRHGVCEVYAQNIQCHVACPPCHVEGKTVCKAILDSASRLIGYPSSLLGIARGAPAPKGLDITASTKDDHKDGNDKQQATEPLPSRDIKRC